MAKKTIAWSFLAAALGAIALRLCGITWGLPFTFNADEPHVINLAVSFGGGSLRPYSFKYPTLWPYLLFACYGLYFLVWSGLGLWRSVSDFIGLYAWHPGGFYLIARLLSTAFTLLGAAALWRSDRDYFGRTPRPWAALLLAFSPVLIELAHSAKPDALMFFLSCVAWHFAMRLYHEGDRAAHWACGAFFGLAMSAQYSAGPAALLLPAAHFLGKKKAPVRWLLEGMTAAAAGFLAGSPYALLDFQNFKFWMSMRSPTELAVFGSLDRGAMLRRVLWNAWSFAGPGAAGLAAAVGLARLWAKDKRLVLVVAAPIAFYTLILSSDPNGGWQRFLLGCYPGLALLASVGLTWAEGLAVPIAKPLWAALLACAALGPGVYLSAAADRDMRLPDTRREAEAWIIAHVPQGSTLLLDQPHVSPQLAMVKEQAAEFAQKTQEMGSPRSRLYRGMVETHPGGGYRLLRIQHSAENLGTYRLHAKLSQAESPTLDVSAGIGALREARVGYVVATSYAAEPDAEHKPLIDALSRAAELLASFEPAPGRKTGPFLRVYRMK
ncbi:MAG: glycosyltransferase family 39 protein [Elusimicrobia bacterium]|nr:glycosyltransferase family 39 protein [Elusimicrobiota bacterium]